MYIMLEEVLGDPPFTSSDREMIRIGCKWIAVFLICAVVVLVVIPMIVKWVKTKMTVNKIEQTFQRELEKRMPKQEDNCVHDEDEDNITE